MWGNVDWDQVARDSPAWSRRISALKDALSAALSPSLVAMLTLDKHESITGPIKTKVLVGQVESLAFRDVWSLVGEWVGILNETRSNYPVFHLNLKEDRYVHGQRMRRAATGIPIPSDLTLADRLGVAVYHALSEIADAHIEARIRDPELARAEIRRELEEDLDEVHPDAE